MRLFHASDGGDGLGKEEGVVVGEGTGDEVKSNNKDDGEEGKLGEGPDRG